MNKIVVLLGCALTVAFCGGAQGELISHVPNDMMPPVVQSPAFGPLAAGGAVGTAGIPFGVDYSYGGVEGIFSDPPNAISGVNANNIVDLVSDVDGAIVVPGTTTQGLTSYLSVEAGHSASGNLLLEVFDASNTLITSVVNGPPLGPHGRHTMTIDRGGVFDISFFRVSTPASDTYGVNQIDLERPVAVPAPGALLLGSIGVGLVGWLRRRRIP